jgi:NRPS condensation-like uncharacterized protein
MQKQKLEKRAYERELVIERIHLRGIYNNIKMITRLDTPIPGERLPEAVKKLSITHPLLASRVVLDGEGRSSFTTEGVPDIPVRIYEKNSPESYREALNKEDENLINIETGPLSKVILLKHPENPDIILYAHHVACDGLSLLHASRHLLEYLADPSKEAQIIEPIPYSEEILRRYPPNFVNKLMIKRVNADWSKRRRVFTEAEYHEMQRGCQRDQFVHIGFTEERTLELRERCRREGVTVNSALVTAMLSGTRATPELRRSDEVAFTVNIRGMLERDPGEACGMYASGVSFDLRYRDASGFWDNARAAHDLGKGKLSDPDALFGRRASSIILDPTVFDAMIFATFGGFKDKLIEKFRGKFAKMNLGGILTNLGGVTIPREYGSMRVSDVLFLPPASGGGVLAVAASSIMGKLDVMIPYREDVLPREVVLRFSDAFQKTLHEALNGDVAIS